ncbi:MAG: tripartite tricarboxylate transporter substrate binding protein [Candidatus Rokubacteria bacterium]|nr:tripartite tricarboxylate transporter substrate binding protein [Candidatus Rokubacteria bacterium]
MRRIATVLVLALLMLVPGAWAQEMYPSRPITVIAPFPPGGVTDITARPLVAVLERVLKQPVVIANKPGAAGTVGRQAVAVSKPDGYTLLVDLVSISNGPPVDELFGRPASYRLDQFVGIARLTNDIPILVVNAQAPWKSAAELVADLKKRPGEYIFSSSGLYGASHVPMAWFLQAAGNLQAKHLPTTGGGPAMTAVLGNHAQMWVSPTGVAAPHIKAGKVRALATLSGTRHPRVSDVPALQELGYDIEYYFWVGLFAPKNVPPPALKVLGDAVRQAAQDPEFKGAMDKVQTEIAYLDAEQFKQFWEREARTVDTVIKRIGKIETKK